MAAESVAGTAGHETKDGGRAYEGLRHLVDHAVTADRDHQLTAILHGGSRQPGGVMRPLRRRDRGVRRVFSDERADTLQQGPMAAVATSARIIYEPDLQLRQTRLRTAGRKPSFHARRDCAPPCFQADRPGMDRVLYVLTGPTAVGKTELALRWAEAFGAEIVSCDSLLFYRGMDIGTAKPTPAERRRVPHHLVDILDITQTWDVAHYVTSARAVCEDIRARGRRVLVSGGSGFYLKAFFAPVADDVEIPAEVRRAVAARLDRDGLAAVVKDLRALNPEGVGALDVRNPRRVVRALERCLASQRTLADLAEAFARQTTALCRLAIAGRATGPAPGRARCAHRRPRPPDAG